MRIKVNKSKKDASICQAGKSRFVINSNGNVYGRGLFMEPAFKGNSLNDSSTTLTDGVNR
jgi:hypothetical protein